MLLTASTRIEALVISNVVVIVLSSLYSLGMDRASRSLTKARNVTQVKHRSEVIAALGLVLATLDAISLVVLAVLGDVPLVVVPLVIAIAGWALYWLPVKHRLVTSQASIIVDGTPNRVWAFVADIPGQVGWIPSAVSYTPDIPGPRGPRYKSVEKMPDGKEIASFYEVTREPGVEVVLWAEGAGVSADHYTFAAEGGGTRVTKRTVLELPYLLALIGGMFVGNDVGAAKQRRVVDVQRLKAAFESSASPSED